MSVKTTRWIYSLIIAAVIIPPLVLFGSGFFPFYSGKVLPGIEVMGVELGGLNRAEGMERLTELEKNLRATRVYLHYQDLSESLLLNEAGINLNKEAVMEDALNTGRQGTVIQRWQDSKQRKEAGLSVQPVIEFDREKLARKIKELAGEVIVKPQDAAFKINNDDTVTIIPGKNGTDVDLDRLEKDIMAVLGREKPQVTLSMIEVPPDRSTAMVESMGINGFLNGYTTRFDPSQTSRTYNIRVAAQAFDELLVKPGHEVSFNDVVGPRSSEAGYKSAPVIVNNELVDGLGGGVCQVSTTLYNSVLLANLEITTRANHSLPVSYVPIGRDATVVYGAIDLKFRNNTDSYLYIKSYVQGRQLTFKIYGNNAYKRDVTINSWITGEIEPKVVYENDPNLPKGEQVVKQEGAKGFNTSAERVIRSNGVVEKREALPVSNYSPVNKVIAVGTAEHVPPQIAPSTPSSTEKEADRQNKLPVGEHGRLPHLSGGTTNERNGDSAGDYDGGSARSVIPGVSSSPRYITTE